MAGNAAPATLTITSSIGPGQPTTALKFTDVQDIEFDFFHNIIKVMHQGSGSTNIFDYSAMNTITVSIVNGATTMVISS
jgi:hypothetical protein